MSIAQNEREFHLVRIEHMLFNPLTSKLRLMERKHSWRIKSDYHQGYEGAIMDYNQRNLELLDDYKNGNKGAKDKLIAFNEKLVKCIAYRFTFNGKFEFEDLCQEGYIGLMRAIDLFSSSFNTTFSHYASFWIKQRILRYIQNAGATIRIPVHVREKLSLLYNAIRDLSAELGHEPSSFEIAKHLGISIYEVERLNIISSDIVSLDQPFVKEDSETSLIDTIQADQESMEDIVERMDICSIVRKAVDKLPPHKRDTIKLLFGLTGKEYNTIEAGKILNCSLGSIQAAKKSALCALRKNARIRELRIERRLNKTTNFYDRTENVVLWRERQRRIMNNMQLDKKYKLYTNITYKT